MKYLSRNLAETKEIAKKFLSGLGGYRRDQALVIGLSGDLGSAKTAFVKACAEILGIEETVTSPTFVIMKKYPLSENYGNLKINFLIHIDAYRLESGQELEVLGWPELVSNPQNLILIEWPERVADILPAGLSRINFQFMSETERAIDF